MIAHRDYTDSGNSIIKVYQIFLKVILFKQRDYFIVNFFRLSNSLLLRMSKNFIIKEYQSIKLSALRCFGMYDERIEFFNPGKLFGDITIEKLQSGDYSSRARNRLLARAFKEAGVIEQYGSGIERIKSACKKSELKEPLFEEFSHGFRATLFKMEVSSSVSGGVSGGVSQLLEFIKSNPNLKAQQLSDNLNQPLRTIERWLKQLKDDNKIEYKGSNKTGGYFIKDAIC